MNPPNVDACAVKEIPLPKVKFSRLERFYKKTKTLKINAPNSFFQNESQLLLYNFGLFQQVFENLKLNKLVKEERRLNLEDRI